MKSKKLRYVGRYVIEDTTLGKGNFAVVELATHTITKTKVAIKVIDRHQIKEDYVRQHLNREARILGQLRHPNVVRLYETISSSSLYCLVTEYAGGGDLLSFVRSQRDGRLVESDARPYVRQLVSALHHLHERGVVHRDLKMENIMMDTYKKNIKIVDFGLSNYFSADQLLSTHCGSPEYAAPELFTAGNDYYGPEVDIWSLGINIYAMVCGKLPFTTPHSENRRQRLLQQLRYGLGPIQEKDMLKLSEECRDLLHMCIEPNPELRAPLLDIEVQPWINDNGMKPFCPYKQPRKDPSTRLAILDKMAVLLNLTKEKIESHIHEYRLDNISAIFNLLMDDHFSSKGYWKTDHTMFQEVKRGHVGASNVAGISVEIKRQGEEQSGPDDVDQNPDSVRVSLRTPTIIDPGSVRVSLRTPTIIGMVRPSQANPQPQRRLKSADFELRAIANPDAKIIRPKTASFAQATKAKPMGNATTQNIVVARFNNFGLAHQNQVGRDGKTQGCRDSKRPQHSHCEQEQRAKSSQEQRATSFKEQRAKTSQEQEATSFQEQRAKSSQEQKDAQNAMATDHTKEQKRKLRFWTEADGNNLRDNHKRQTFGSHDQSDGQGRQIFESHNQESNTVQYEETQERREGKRREQQSGEHLLSPRGEQRQEQTKILIRVAHNEIDYTEINNEIQQNMDFSTSNEIIKQSTRSALPESREPGRVQFAPITESPNFIDPEQQAGFEEMDPNTDSHKEVKVINMVQYFNNKHGYKIRETPVNVYAQKTAEPVITSKVNRKSIQEPQVSYQLCDPAKLCDEHRSQVASELVPAANTVTYKRYNPFSGPGLRKEDEVQTPPTIDIKLPRQDEGYQSDSESERGRSVTPQKAKWRPRLYKQLRRTPSPSPSEQTPCPHSCNCSPPCRSSISERPLYCTPVDSLQATQDVLNCTPMQAVDPTKSNCEDLDTLKNRMPQRSCWKKQDALESALRKQVAEMKKENSAKARELMKKDSLHEKYPQEANMRLQSARLRTPVLRSAKPSTARASRTAPSSPSKPRQVVSPRHATCSARSPRSGFRMDKYSGQCTPKELASNVIDLSKQHMLTLLQEASATLENATKMAERKQCQSHLHYYHQASHQRQPDKSWQKAIQQLKPHHHDTPLDAMLKKTDSITDSYDKKPTSSRPGTVRTLGKSRCYSSGARAARGIESQLGQRVTYTEGNLNPCTGRPPTMSTPSPQPVFDVESSRNTRTTNTVNYRLSKMSAKDQAIADWARFGRARSRLQGPSQTNSQEWNIGYILERKLSNTIKGGGQISQMRNTPYHMQ